MVDYDRAVPLPGATTVLARLAERFALVAVISGRPVEYLIRNLAGAGATRLVGLYGMERGHAATGDVQRVAAAEPWERPLSDAADAAEAAAPLGLVVERKGLAVTLHFRSAPDLEGWANRFTEATARRTGLVVHPGKRSFELRPPVETDKGTVVRELAEGMESVCFLGDDVGDLPAFAELARMRAEGERVTLSVAVDSAETPPALVEAADLVVPGPPAALDLLRTLAGGVEGEKTPG